MPRIAQKRPNLLTMVAQSASQFTGRMAADTIWALAKLQHWTPQLVDALGCQLRDYMQQMDSQDLCLAVWGFASLQQQPESFLLPVLLQQVCCTPPSSEMWAKCVAVKRRTQQKWDHQAVGTFKLLCPAMLFAL